MDNSIPIIIIIIIVLLLLYPHPFDPIKFNVEDEDKDKNIKFGVNGKLDVNTRQGCGKDCWILAALITLNSTKKGRKIIKDSINFSSEKEIKIYFQGIKKQYTISQDELLKYYYTKNFSKGDNDILMFEIATGKLRIDLANNVIKTNIGKCDYNNGEKQDCAKALCYGYSSSMLYYLTGKIPTTYNLLCTNKSNKISNIMKELAEKSINSQLAATFTLNKGNYIFSSNKKITLEDVHSFAIVDIDAENIATINPWNTEDIYIFNIEDFSKLDILEITILDLS